MVKVSTRFEVFKRDGFTCRYCGHKTPDAILEIDHVIPSAAGGGDEIENLVTACYECNRGKGPRLITDAPTEINLHEQTIAIAEREIQLAEYNQWRARQRIREDESINRLEKYWVDRWGSQRWWNRASVRSFLRKLAFADLLDILDVVEHKTELRYGGWEHSAWIFFCGMCRNQIKRNGDANA